MQVQGKTIILKVFRTNRTWAVARMPCVALANGRPLHLRLLWSAYRHHRPQQHMALRTRTTLTNRNSHRAQLRHWPLPTLLHTLDPSTSPTHDDASRTKSRLPILKNPSLACVVYLTNISGLAQERNGAVQTHIIGNFPRVNQRTHSAHHHHCRHARAMDRKMRCHHRS